VFVFQNLNSALREAKHIAKQQGKDEVFVIGGGQIFAQAISLADKLYLTIIEDEFKADTFFPDYSEFKKVVFEKPGEEGNYKYKFIDLEK
jgi:dihydrofolate reductase